METRQKKNTTTTFMDNKQTAVEWLLEQMIQYGLVPKGTHSDNVLFHKAKEMEKSQIKDAVNYGCSDWGSFKDAEQYYNETYGK